MDGESSSTRPLPIDERMAQRAAMAAMAAVCSNRSQADWPRRDQPGSTRGGRLAQNDPQRDTRAGGRSGLCTGRAIQEALTTLKASTTHQRDVWHLLPLASQMQGRVDRSLDKLQEQLATVVRQAERLATGQKARGAHPVTNVQAQTELITQTGRVAEGLRYLFGELRRLCEV